MLLREVFRAHLLIYVQSNLCEHKHIIYIRTRLYSIILKGFTRYAIHTGKVLAIISWNADKLLAW